MIHIQYNEAAGRYQLREFELEYEDGTTEIDDVTPLDNDDVLGIDWTDVKPSCIEDHGTMIVLFGDHREQDTILGDPRFDGEKGSEQTIHGIAAYLNARLWEVPEKIEIEVVEFNTNDKSKWPKSSSSHGGYRIGGYIKRRIFGLKYFATARHGNPEGFNVEHGFVPMDDGLTQIEWYLWPRQPSTKSDDKGAPQLQPYTVRSGSISVLYKNELYNIRTHGQSLNMFGISIPSVRQSLWLIVRPPEHDKDAKTGVYPRSDRGLLSWHGGRELPFDEWAESFRRQMPEPIVQALKMARGSKCGTIEDEDWRQELSTFVPLWKISRLVPSSDGDKRGGLLSSISTIFGRIATPGPGPGPGLGPIRKKHKRRVVTVPEGDDQLAKSKTATGSIPNYLPVRETLEDGFLAVYTEPNKDEPAGLITFNVEHPAFKRIVEFHQSQLPDCDPETVRDIVEQAYGHCLAAKVAHSEAMRGSISRENIALMRSPAALTLALLGIMPEHPYVVQQLKKKARLTKRAA
jgi:hypothetical protein